jgi:PA14 domain/DNA/RNA non-specific endonuclease
MFLAPLIFCRSRDAFWQYGVATVWNSIADTTSVVTSAAALCFNHLESYRGEQMNRSIRNNIFAACILTALIGCSQPQSATPTSIPSTVKTTATVPAASLGLQAEYFGTLDFTGLKVSQTDAQLSFDWGQLPATSGLKPGALSARWSGTLTAPQDGTYTIYVAASGGAKFFVGDQPAVEQGTSVTVALKAQTPVVIRAEFIQTVPKASFGLEWESADAGVVRQTIPLVAYHHSNDTQNGVVGQVPRDQNLLTNGDFEAGTAGWPGTFDVVTPGANGAGQAANLINNGSFQQNLPSGVVEVGATYILSASAKSSTDAACTVGLATVDVDGKATRTLIPFAGSWGSGWQNGKTTTTLPTGSTFVQIYLGGNSGTCSFDDISLSIAAQPVVANANFSARSATIPYGFDEKLRDLSSFEVFKATLKESLRGEDFGILDDEKIESLRQNFLKQSAPAPAAASIQTLAGTPCDQQYLSPYSFILKGRLQPIVTDDKGRPRITFIRFPPFIPPTEKRDLDCSAAAGKIDNQAGYVGGHLIGYAIGGYDGRENMVPQERGFNSGTWSQVELALRKCTAFFPFSLTWTVSLSYDDPAHPITPTMFWGNLSGIGRDSFQNDQLRPFTITIGFYNAGDDDSKAKNRAVLLDFRKGLARMGCAPATKDTKPALIKLESKLAGIDRENIRVANVGEIDSVLKYGLSNVTSGTGKLKVKTDNLAVFAPDPPTKMQALQIGQGSLQILEAPPQDTWENGELTPNGVSGGVLEKTEENLDPSDQYEVQLVCNKVDPKHVAYVLVTAFTGERNQYSDPIIAQDNVEINARCTGPVLDIKDVGAIAWNLKFGETAKQSFTFANKGVKGEKYNDPALLEWTASVQKDSMFKLDQASGSVEVEGNGTFTISATCTKADIEESVNLNLHTNDLVHIDTNIPVKLKCGKQPPSVSVNIVTTNGYDSAGSIPAGGNLKLINIGTATGNPLVWSTDYGSIKASDDGTSAVLSVPLSNIGNKDIPITVTAKSGVDNEKVDVFVTSATPLTVNIVTYNGYDSAGSLPAGGSLKLVNIGTATGNPLIWSTNYGTITPAADGTTAVLSVPLANTGNKDIPITVTAQSSIDEEKIDTLSTGVTPLSVNIVTYNGYDNAGSIPAGGSLKLVSIGTATGNPLVWSTSYGTITPDADGVTAVLNVPLSNMGNRDIPITVSAKSTIDPEKTDTLSTGVTPLSVNIVTYNGYDEAGSLPAGSSLELVSIGTATGNPLIWSTTYGTITPGEDGARAVLKVPLANAGHENIPIIITAQSSIDTEKVDVLKTGVTPLSVNIVTYNGYDSAGLTSGDQLKLVSIGTETGNPLSWSTSSGTITPSADGRTAIFSAPGLAPGASVNATVTATSTIDPEKFDTLNIVVTGRQ